MDIYLIITRLSQGAQSVTPRQGVRDMSEVRFDCDDPQYTKYVTGDQCTMANFKGTIAIGGYRYAFVWCKIDSGFLDFILMHSMDADTAENTFREFCSTFVNTDDDVRLLVMYCDAHRSLIRMCDN